jgi:hypothetical protein
MSDEEEKKDGKALEEKGRQKLRRKTDRTNK